MRNLAALILVPGRSGDGGRYTRECPELPRNFKEG